MLERGAMSEIRLERGALNTENGLERGAILEMAGTRSADGKIGGWSAERCLPLAPSCFHVKMLGRS